MAIECVTALLIYERHCFLTYKPQITNFCRDCKGEVFFAKRVRRRGVPWRSWREDVN